MKDCVIETHTSNGVTLHRTIYRADEEVIQQLLELEQLQTRYVRTPDITSEQTSALNEKLSISTKGPVLWTSNGDNFIFVPTGWTDWVITKTADWGSRHQYFHGSPLSAVIQKAQKRLEPAIESVSVLPLSQMVLQQRSHHLRRSIRLGAVIALVCLVAMHRLSISPFGSDDKGLITIALIAYLISSDWTRSLFRQLFY
jgi:hypothetical protein